MAKDIHPGKADRLNRVLGEARAHATRSAAPRSSSGDAAVVRSAKSLIKYPRNITALRQHVEETRKADAPAPTVRLRIRPGLAQGAQADSKPPAERIQGDGPMPSAGKGEARRASKRRTATPTEPSPISTVLALGDVVRHARRRQGLSQADVAALAGTGRRFISELEAGKPTLEFERLLQVCRVLGIRLLAAEAEQ